jgi:hypothetical protein
MRRFLLLIALMPLTALAQTPYTDSQLQEAMAACDSMTIYVQFAQRQHSMGMALDTSKKLLNDAMQTNLKMEEPEKAAVIALADTIFEYVYAAKTDAEAAVGPVLSNTCGSYRGFNIPLDVVSKHVAATVTSAWDPMQRVSLCTKLAQTVSNIGAARDKGLSRQQITDAANAALADDKVTLARLPELIAEVYDNADVKLPYFFGYHLTQCRTQASGGKLTSFHDVKPGILKCQAETSTEAENKCANVLFDVHG